jgi:hypothetical protein
MPKFNLKTGIPTAQNAKISAAGNWLGRPAATEGCAKSNQLRRAENSYEELRRIAVTIKKY